MARKFRVKLNLEGMRELKKQLTHYRRVTLTECLNNFVSDLADKGIKVGYMNVHDELKGYIAFTKEIKDTKYNYKPKAIMIAYNAHEFTSIWYRGTERIEEDVNAVLMAEYGSGQYAIKGWRGTYPTTSSKKPSNATRGSWAWAEEPFTDSKNVEWHIYSGYRPSMPMWNAYVEMDKEIANTAKYSFMRTNV